MVYLNTKFSLHIPYAAMCEVLFDCCAALLAASPRSLPPSSMLAARRGVYGAMWARRDEFILLGRSLTRSSSSLSADWWCRIAKRLVLIGGFRSLAAPAGGPTDRRA